MTELEKNIKNIIEEISECKYVGDLKVVKEDITGESPLWMLLLYLDLEQSPMIWAYQGTEEAFLEFIKGEVKMRKLHTIHFWKGVQNIPDVEEICDPNE